LGARCGTSPAAYTTGWDQRSLGDLRASGVERGDVRRQVEEVDDSDRVGDVGGRSAGQKQIEERGEVGRIEAAVGSGKVRGTVGSSDAKAAVIPDEPC
jgi:hypothetical protein